MVRFINQELGIETSQEIQQEIAKHEDLIKSGFGTDHCNLQPHGKPWKNRDSKDDLLFVTVFAKWPRYLFAFPRHFIKDYNKDTILNPTFYWPKGLPNHGKFLGQVNPQRWSL